ncbi:MAG: hypothetical protein M1450_04930 [Patescibacteria group bacterium]|nr:hypothetical protein [Patescibacteria group bacterium]
MKRSFLKPLDFFLNFFPYVLVFITSLFMPGDPDLGWHLKYGEYFFKNHQVLRDNTFSTMMANYHWANTSWGTDLITFFFYNILGFWGLAIFSSTVVTLTFFFFSKAAKLSAWEQILIFPLLIYLESPLNVVSFRGQQLSILFIGILFFILSAYKEKIIIFKKFSFERIYLVVPLFLIWVNTHGEFILGLGLFFIWIIIDALQKIYSKEKNSFINKKILILLVLSLLATTINPFGIGIHKEVLMHFGSPLLKDVGEYLPFNFSSQLWWNHLIVSTLIVIGVLFLFLDNKHKKQIPIIGISLLLFALSWWVRRYAWPAYYLSLPLLQPVAMFFKPDRKRDITIASAALISIYFLVIFIQNPFQDLKNLSWEKYCRQQNLFCSPKSANFLIEKKLTNNLLALYGWGGWLIWNYPEIKPAIDGRMHLWEDEKGYSAFEYYYSLEQNFKSVDASNYDVVYMPSTKPIFNELLHLVKFGKWKLVYLDNFAGIFVRNKK